MRGAKGSVFTWAGLLLMAASLVWLHLLPRPARPVVTSAPRPPDELFSLVVFDPGHGGTDSGAMCGAILEKDLTLDIAKRAQRLIQLLGFETMLTREGDQFVPLANRAAFANRQRECIFVSIHFNDGKRPASSGIETYYAGHRADAGTGISSWLPFLHRTTTQSPNFHGQSLAGFIQNALVSRTQAMNRGTKAEQFYVIANVRHPAVLVEGGFLTNKEEVAKLESEEYRERMASAICEGIVQYRDTLRDGQSALAMSAAGG